MKCRLCVVSGISRAPIICFCALYCPFLKLGWGGPSCLVVKSVHCKIVTLSILRGRKLPRSSKALETLKLGHCWISWVKTSEFSAKVRTVGCFLHRMTPEWGTIAGELPPETQFLLVELEEGGPYAVILPLIDKGTFRGTLRSSPRWAPKISLSPCLVGVSAFYWWVKHKVLDGVDSQPVYSFGYILLPYSRGLPVFVRIIFQDCWRLLRGRAGQDTGNWGVGMNRMECSRW